MGQKKFFLFRDQPDQEYVPNKDLFAYATGLAGQNMAYGFETSWLFYFCNTILKIDSEKVGWITSISRTWDAINDPIIGMLVDKHQFKNGEKLRPYLVLTPPLIGVLTALMFVNFGLSQGAALALILIFYLMWDLIYSYQDVAIWGMVAMSSPHSDERGRVSQWVSIGAGAGGAIAGIFPLIKSDNVLTALHMTPQTMFLIGGLFFGLGGELLSMLAHKMKERIPNKKSDESLGAMFRVLMMNHTLLKICLARFLVNVTLTLDWAYFFESSVSFKVGSHMIDGGTSQFLYGILVGIPGGLAMFVATKIADKVGGMKKLLVIAQICAISLRIISYFVGFQSIWQMAVVIVLMAVVQIPTGLMDIAHRSILSDSIDYIEWKTGERTEGVSFSMQNLISKLGSAVSYLIKGYILKFLGYDKNKAMTAQGAVFNKWQWPLFMLGPVLGEVLYLIAISFVKDDKAQKMMIETELKQKRRLEAAEEGEYPGQADGSETTDDNAGADRTDN